MAAIAAGDTAMHGITLTAGIETTVQYADDCAEVEILTDGAATTYYTVDGTTASVPSAGASTKMRILPACPCSVTEEPPTSGSTKVRLISNGTPTISVTRTA